MSTIVSCSQPFLASVTSTQMLAALVVVTIVPAVFVALVVRYSDRSVVLWV
jgi:hypothetical protein